MSKYRNSSWPYWCAASCILLPLLYVASYGPAYRLAHEGFLSREMVTVVYRPLWYAIMDGPDWLGRMLLYYLQLCGSYAPL